MHKCFKCGTEFEGNFCPECGSKWLEEKYCPQCGAMLAGSTKFCNNCGYAFVETKEKKPKKENPTLQKIGAFFVNLWVWIKSHLKIVIPSACALVVLIVMLSLIPTFIVASVNGTYYAYYFDENGEMVFSENNYITLSTGKWTDGETDGKYSKSGSDITLTYEDQAMKELGSMFGEDVDAKVELKGTIKNGVLTVTQGPRELVLAKKNHKHKYGKWEVTKAVTCTDEGERFHVCACTKEEREMISATGHKTFSNGFCTACSTPELQYEERANGYYVAGFTNGVKIAELTILAEYNGKPVIGIGYNAFAYRNDITSVTLPNSITYVDSGAFYSCWGLMSVTLPDGVTSIESDAFGSCGKLTSITIPNSVQWIGIGAFSSCSKLTTITFNGTKDQWKAIEKGAWWAQNCNFTIQCTDGALDKSGNEIA